MIRSARVEIDSSALQHNLARVKSFAPNSRVMAVIKANAYGHGLLTAAQALSAADAFALAMPSEAVALRDAGIQHPLIVFHGFSSLAELTLLAEKKLQPVIHQAWQLELLEQYSGAELDVWLKLDTGMHRLGIFAQDFESAYQRLKQCACVNQISVMSHFANADTPQDEKNNQQMETFAAVTEAIKIERSLANSAALIALKQSHYDWVRPGIMLYGASPIQGTSAQQLDLKPVMQFESQLLSIKKMRKADCIGYGSSWACPEDMDVGVVAAGYGDGYPRHAQAGTPVWLAGKHCPLVGRVSMDSVCVDLRGVDVKVGERVVLWGEELSVDTVAENASSIAYELLCNAGNAAGLG